MNKPKKKPKKKGRPPGRTKKATNVSLDRKLVEEAEELGVRLSPACEDGLSRAVRKAKKERGA